jgi:hypothetical protein
MRQSLLPLVADAYAVPLMCVFVVVGVLCPSSLCSWLRVLFLNVPLGWTGYHFIMCFGHYLFFKSYITTNIGLIITELVLWDKFVRLMCSTLEIFWGELLDTASSSWILSRICYDRIFVRQVCEFIESTSSSVLNKLSCNPIFSRIFFHPLAPHWSLLSFWSIGLISQFLDHFTDDRTPWTSDQFVARPLPIHRTTQAQKHTHTHTKHLFPEWDLNPRSRLPD